MLNDVKRCLEGQEKEAGAEWKRSDERDKQLSEMSVVFFLLAVKDVKGCQGMSNDIKRCLEGQEK
jgi:hypothetical protein